MKGWLKYLCIICLLTPGSKSQCLYGQVSGEFQEWQVPQLKTFDTLALNAYKSQPAFQYGDVRKSNESLWSLAKSWFWNKMDELFGTDGSMTGMIIFLTFLGLGVIALVYYLMRVQDFSPFRKADRKTGKPAELFDEKIDPEDLDRAIAEAKATSDYRKAVRYLTIRMFNDLEQAGMLEMDPSTTMEQYRQQLRNGRFSGDFDILTRYFEFIWYGEYDLRAEDFVQIEQRFEDFSENMKKVI